MPVSSRDVPVQRERTLRRVPHPNACVARRGRNRACFALKSPTVLRRSGRRGVVGQTGPLLRCLCAWRSSVCSATLGNVQEERLDDHLRGSVDEGVEGAYTPLGFQLRGGGSDTAADALAHVHEAHHGALNDSTAWGSALHITARLPGHRDAFLVLLELCRRVHEAFATYASVSLVRHAKLADLAVHRYHRYLPALRAVNRFVAAVDSPIRRYLLVTQVARACMQTSVLDELVANEGVPRSRLRTLDTPDGRWAWYLRRGTDLAEAAARSADDAALELGDGELVIELDRSAAEGTTAVAHDEVWARWERAAYATLAMELGATGAVLLDFDGHQEPTQRAVRWAKAHFPGIRLAAAVEGGPARDDRTLAAATLEQARHAIAVEPWAAAQIELPPEELIAEVQANCRIDGAPMLIFDARPSSRLRSMYSWTPPDSSFPDSPDPIVAVRLCEGDAVLHNVVRQPSDLHELVEEWAGAGLVASCVSVSCLADRTWQQTWLPSLRRVGDLTFLIDVELDRFLKNWAGSAVELFGIEIKDTTSTRFAAAAQINQSGEPWVAVGDELTANLVLSQIRDTPGLSVSAHGPLDERASRLLKAIITHLLGTESYFDLAGLLANP